jgi:hypothetical protein
MARVAPVLGSAECPSWRGFRTIRAAALRPKHPVELVQDRPQLSPSRAPDAAGVPRPPPSPWTGPGHESTDLHRRGPPQVPRPLGPAGHVSRGRSATVTAISVCDCSAVQVSAAIGAAASCKRRAAALEDEDGEPARELPASLARGPAVAHRSRLPPPHQLSLHHRPALT